MAVEQRLTLPQAVERLFGIPLARHAVLRNAVNTLVKAMSQAKMLQLAENEISHTNGGRKRWTIPERELTTLSNAIVLQGIFGEPKTVVLLFTHPERLNKHADWAKSLLLDRQSVASIGLINHELLGLLEQLASNADLKAELLPNPFENTLPQMGLSEYGGNLLKTLVCQTAALSTGNSMMAHYLSGELEQANDAACQLQTDNPLLLQYRQLIIRTYAEAKEFDALLDEWR